MTAEVMGKLLANELVNATNNSQTATSAYGINNSNSGSGNTSSSQQSSTGGSGAYNIPR